MNNKPSGTPHFRSTAPRYRHVGQFMIRTPLLPEGAVLDAGADRDLLVDRMRDLSRRPVVRRALAIASPAALRGIDQAVASPLWSEGTAARESGRREVRRVENARATLFRYLTRMSTRPTPFGMFSGVGFGRFAEGEGLRLAHPVVDRVVARPDASAIDDALGWTMSDMTSSEFPLHVNPLLHDTEMFLLLNDFDPLVGERRTVRVRKNPALTWLIDRLGTAAVAFADLQEILGTRFPEVGAPLVESMLAQLVGARILVPAFGLRIGSTSPARLLGATLIERGGSAGDRGARLAAMVGEADRTARDLTAAARDEEEVEGGRGFEGLHVDTVVSLAEAALPLTVAEAAEEMAGLLALLGGLAPVPRHLETYHEAFMERFGSEAAVPLLDLLAEETGLGAPDSYSAPARGVPLDTAPAPASRHLGVLVSALVSCLKEGGTEIELTDHLLEGLRLSAGPRVAPPRPSLDVHLQILAPDREAVRAGDFTAVLAPFGASDGLRTMGRFSHVMDEQGHRFLEEFASAETERIRHLSANSATKVVDVHYRASDRRSANVTFHHSTREWEINVEAMGSGVAGSDIRLGDILVRADGNGFRFEQASTGEPLHFVQSHLLNYSTAPNPIRFLLEVSDWAHVAPGHFDWCELTASPFLPRVRRGRLVLSPAMWRVSAVRLGFGPQETTPARSDMKKRLTDWLRRTGVPDHVYLTQADNRLLLDLRQPLAVEELVSELLRDHAAKVQSGVILQESGYMPGGSWLVDDTGQAYAHEIVVPLLYETPDQETAADTTGRRAETDSHTLPAVVDPVHQWLPGEHWTSLYLHTDTERITEVVSAAADHFASLQHRGLSDRWFFVCYADTSPLVRVRFRSRTAESEDSVLAESVRWARGLVRDRGIVHDVHVHGYVPEVTRYGGQHLWEEALGLFQMDSEAAVLLRPSLESSEVPAEVWGAAVLLCETEAWGGDPAPPDLRDVDEDARATFKEYGPLLRSLAGTGAGHPLPERLARIAEQVREAGGRRDAALRAYGERTRVLEASRGLTVEPEVVCGSLMHMSMNRLLGIDTKLETRASMLVRLARHRRDGRRPAAIPDGVRTGEGTGS